jgi:serine/threonine protein phosphatase PrpC
MAGLPGTRLAPDLPGGPRAALAVATTRYEDPELRQLRAPARDAEDLAEVLERQTRRAIDVFLSGRGVGDLVVVYLSCHGVLDRRNRLYFAASDTLKAQLGSTGIPAAWLMDELEECRARSKVLILDCCFSGAFAHGSKGNPDLDLERRLAGNGRGQAVLTASRAGEYSFEGQALPGAVTTGSVFTVGLVEGLRTGAADVGGDGYVSVDEAFEYAYGYVQSSGASQTPQRWLYGGEGAIVLARSPAGIAVPSAPLPEALAVSLDSPYPAVRIGAVNALSEWLSGADPARALTAEQKLRQIADTDVPVVATAARTCLQGLETFSADYGGQESPTARRAINQLAAQERARRETEEHTRLEHAATKHLQGTEQPQAEMRVQNRDADLAVSDQPATLDIPFSGDHGEANLGPIAGVTDRGLQRQRNEDAMAMAAEHDAPDGPTVLAVVCSGVSTSARPAEASKTAAQTALPVLIAAVREGADLSAASLAAEAAARGSVAKLIGPSDDISATMFLSVVASGHEVTICWLGNSRAYWLAQAPSQSRLLTRDDSVVAVREAAGLPTEAARLTSPHLARYSPPDAGALLACSAGLWNYLPDPADLSKIALPKALTDPFGAAHDLVKSAIDAGGAHNITAVLIPYLAPDAPDQ